MPWKSRFISCTVIKGRPVPPETAELAGPPPGGGPRPGADRRAVGENAEIHLLRIIDAAANRAREGLRVVEDYVRFALDDRHLTEQLKRLRHNLAAALGRLPAGYCLARGKPRPMSARR